MRVLVVTTWFPDIKSQATAPFNLNYIQAIAQWHDVQVIHVRLGGAGAVVSEEFGGVPVTRIPLSPRRPLGYVAVVGQVRAALKGVDVLHTMAFTSALVAAPIHALVRKPWVHTEHWSGMAQPASVSKLWAAFSWLRYALKLPHAVTAVSAAQAGQLARFARAGAITVIPNVVHHESPLAARRGIARGTVRLVVVGGLIERKRPLLALETLRLLRLRGIDVVLTLVGDGPLRADLEAAAAAAGLADKLTITGLLTPEQVREELRASDVFLLPTLHETFCVSAAEAVAAGLPVVVTDLPAVRDFLNPGNSVLISGDLAADFASGIQEAFTRFSHVPAETISATIARRFSPQVVAEQFTAVYARVRGAGG